MKHGITSLNNQRIVETLNTKILHLLERSKLLYHVTIVSIYHGFETNLTH